MAQGSRCTRTRTDICGRQDRSVCSVCGCGSFSLIKKRAGDGNLRLWRKVLAALEHEPTSAAGTGQSFDAVCGCDFSHYKRESRRREFAPAAQGSRVARTRTDIRVGLVTRFAPVCRCGSLPSPAPHRKTAMGSIAVFLWSRRRESNPREPAWEAGAIPLGDSCAKFYPYYYIVF